MKQALEWIERYEVPSSRETHEGWAVIVIDSKGFLGVVSDYGNYAYHWSSFGDDFRRFLLGLDSSYLHGKLAHEKYVYDGEATAKNISDYIIASRKSNFMSHEEARTEFDLYKQHKSGIRDSKEGFGEWYEDTAIECAFEFHATKPEPECLAFCTKAWPRLVMLIRDRDYVPLASSN